MRRTLLFFVLVPFALSGCASSSHSGAVLYTLTGESNPQFGVQHPESFTYTVPQLIKTEVDLTATQLNSCVACAGTGVAVQFFPNGSTNTIVPVDFIRFTDADGKVYGFFFAPGTFGIPGTYKAGNYPPYITSNTGTLTIQPAP